MWTPGTSRTWWFHVTGYHGEGHFLEIVFTNCVIRCSVWVPPFKTDCVDISKHQLSSYLQIILKTFDTLLNMYNLTLSVQINFLLGPLGAPRLLPSLVFSSSLSSVSFTPSLGPCSSLLPFSSFCLVKQSKKNISLHLTTVSLQWDMSKTWIKIEVHSFVSWHIQL